MGRRSVIAALAIIALCAASGSAGAQGANSAPANGKSVLQGVFTDEQATRGDAEHRANCEACHSTEKYAGEAFVKNWIGRTVFDLFDQLRTTMPDDNPGGLSAQQYTDVVAYIFKINGYPAGAEVLPADPEAMRLIRIEAKPDSQLTRRAPAGTVAVSRLGSHPLRPRYFPHAPAPPSAAR